MTSVKRKIFLKGAYEKPKMNKLNSKYTHKSEQTLCVKNNISIRTSIG